MNCFNEQLIQEYIDGEATIIQSKAMDNHMENCRSCYLKTREQQDLSNLFKKSMNMGIDPNFKMPKLQLPIRTIEPQNHRVKKLIYSLVAACVLAFLFLFTNHQNHIPNEYIIYQSFEFEYDANKSITDQELIINIVDPESNVNLYYLDKN